jgi:hypothetical protein
MIFTGREGVQNKSKPAWENVWQKVGSMVIVDLV